MRWPAIYLDHHSTTPCDPSVVEAMLPWFTEHAGNPGSKHAWGMRARAAVDLAREQVAALIGGQPREIVFTSGATEANNLAILGVAEALEGRRRHLVTLATEHEAVLEPMRHLERRGWTITVLRPEPDGRVHPEQVQEALRDDTALVSIMLANNEIGVLQPLQAIADVCHAQGVLVHTDAAQATGKIPVDVGALGVDLMSLTAHKTHGPKGVGALWVRSGRPRVPLTPRVFGGGQERGLRSGTLPVPMLVGLGRCMALAAEDLEAGVPDRVRTLRDHLWEGLKTLPGVHLNGSLEHRLPNNLSVSFEDADSAALMLALRPIGVSSGSACSTDKPRPSHVLKALGRPDALAWSVLRFGLARTTTRAEVDTAIEAVRTVLPEVRAARAQG